MAGKGPSREPTARLLLRGAKRGKQRAKTEPALPPADSVPPGVLPAAAQVAWDELWPVVSGAGVVKATDRWTLFAFCEAWATYLDALAKVQAEGLTIEDGEGNVSKNPHVAILTDTRTAMLRYMQELGFTPASRSRVTVTKEPSKENSILKLVRAK